MNTSMRLLTSSIALVAGISLVLTGCASPSGETGGAAPDKVTLIVHDSFPGDEFAEAASLATGYDVEVITAGDGGELTSQLALTAAAPVADAFFGVEKIFVSRLTDYDVLSGEAVPVTLSASCINIDTGWFNHHGVAEPTSYEDLASEQYRGLTVLLDPVSSTTGASFLIGTVARFGEDGFADYWQQLADNDVRIEQSWSDAYYGQFTGGGEGSYPIVLSYSSSPAWTLTDDGEASTTKALLDTCSSQVEYAGVLKGAANPEGAQAVVDYMLSREFQDTIAETMYVYPVDAEAYVPEEWQRFAPMPSNPNDLTAEAIGAGREAWLKTWSNIKGW